MYVFVQLNFSFQMQKIMFKKDRNYVTPCGGFIKTRQTCYNYFTPCGGEEKSYNYVMKEKISTTE